MTMTKSELAAQKCAEDAKKLSQKLGYRADHWCAADFLDGCDTISTVAWREFREHVSDLCEHAIASGDTSGLEELVLREPVDPDLLERRKIVAAFYEAAEWPALAQKVRDGLSDDALRRGREIERGEG